jgi:hypothetical protein
MKKYLGLLAFLILLNGCDDGDLTVEAINFTNVTAGSCGEIIYKINGTEALFIKIPATLEPFKNELTSVGSPRPFAIGGDIVVRYRGYNGPVSAENICPNVIQPITPVATVEWIATAGTIEITTTPIYSAPDAVTGRVTLEKYNHNIVIRGLKFSKPDGEQFYDVFTFGDYTTDATDLGLVFPSSNAHICPSGNTIYNIADSRSEGIFIQNIDPALLSITTLNVPKTGLISSATNKLSYRLLQTAIGVDAVEDYFCSSAIPSSPEVNEEWLADDGVANVSGIIEVTTTTNGPSFLHTIRLKGVTFRKGASTFYFGNDILFGEIITN